MAFQQKKTQPFVAMYGQMKSFYFMLKIFVRASSLIKKMITRSVMLFLNSVRRLLTARHLKSEKNGYTRSYKGYCLSSLLTSNI